MAQSFLTPPNTYALSDNVIRGVMQRIRPLHDQYGLPGDDNHSEDTLTQKRPYTKREWRTTASAADPARTTTKLSGRVDIVTGYFGAEGRRAPKLRVTASRRERCRINQARYRDRQRRRVEELGDSISELQQEIQELEAKRQDMERCSPTNKGVWTVAVEFFRLFRHGFMAPTMVPKTSFKAGDPSNKRLLQPQFEFLKATMAADVTDGNVSGTEALLESWNLISVHHSNTQVHLGRLEEVAQDSLLATATISVTVTEHTLRHEYPHLVTNMADDDEDDEAELSPLAAKLLHQRLHIHGSMRFDWDSASRHVARLESKFDILPAMLKLLGNLEDVARVLNKA